MENAEKRDFFISYTQTDKAWALWIADALISNGYSVYAQKLDIRPGDNFIGKMNEFLKNSWNFLAVWSKGYSESRFCMAELQSAFYAWNKGSMDCLLPVRIDAHPMEPLYAGLVHVDLPDMGATSEKKLMDAVRHALQKPPKPPDDPEPALTDGAKSGGRGRKCGVLRYVFLALFLCACIAAIATGFVRWRNDVRLGIEEYEIGESYYEAGDYVQAREHYERAAEKGDADALYSLGYLHEKGLGVVEYYGKARDYYERAAKKGNASALNALGYFYLHGLGVGPNYEKAADYYKRAAKKGNASALNALGYLYLHGLGVRPNYEKAWDYYERAAEKGNASAMYNLGSLYEEDLRNYNAARYYYELAAEKGNVEAMNHLGWMYAYGEGMEAWDYDKARRYYELAAEKGNVEAMNCLGWMYEYGEGMEAPDYATALEWYRKAEDAGDKAGAVKVAELQEKLDGESGGA